MTVFVLVPGALRADTDRAGRLALEVDGTLGAVLDELAEHWPRLERRLRDERRELRRYVNVYIDGDDCRALAGQASPVPPNAEIQLLPSIAGG
jgi:molybdopterin converting factor small subunit